MTPTPSWTAASPTTHDLLSLASAPASRPVPDFLHLAYYTREQNVWSGGAVQYKALGPDIPFLSKDDYWQTRQRIASQLLGLSHDDRRGWVSTVFIYIYISSIYMYTPPSSPTPTAPTPPTPA